MINRIYELFKRCFPDIILTKSRALAILSSGENYFICREQGERLTAAAVIRKDTILLLCVDPAFRRQGLGSGLLEEAEKYIREGGYEECLFCEGGVYITPGIPLYPGNRDFFEKRGYIHSWGEEECVDMMMDLKDFHHTTYQIGDTIRGITYRFAHEEEMEAAAECAYAALPEFGQYYRNGELYREGSRERVLIAVQNEDIPDVSGSVKDKRICGALLVGSMEELPGMGSVGCTSVRPSCQGQGIATEMVKLGTRYLKDQGLSRAFLAYTYTGIIPMYGRSGYQVCMKYFMGKKKFIEFQ